MKNKEIELQIGGLLVNKHYNEVGYIINNIPLEIKWFPKSSVYKIHPYFYRFMNNNSFLFSQYTYLPPGISSGFTPKSTE